MHILRQRMTSKQSRLESSGVSALKDKKTGGTTSSGQTQKKKSIDELKSEIIDKLHGLNPETNNSSLKTRIFIDSVLAWEFGEELLQDPAFDSISRDIVESITSDEDVYQKFQSVIEELTA